MITVDADEIDKNHLTAGYVTTARLDDICTRFSIPSACSQLCKNPPASPKPFVELYDDFTLLKIKRELLLMQNYYEHLIDIGEALEENENEIFSKKELRCISGFTQRARRLREDADSLQSAVMHLQDSYQSSLDLKLNNTMNFFTVITAVFFPLTVIVGWYGMNFDSMPELRWRYGYAFVIALSVGVVSLLLYAVKRHRWL